GKGEREKWRGLRCLPPASPSPFPPLSLSPLYCCPCPGPLVGPLPCSSPLPLNASYATSAPPAIRPPMTPVPATASFRSRRVAMAPRGTTTCSPRQCVCEL